jgi:putative Ca2+/H+ antiporter (TMEM165/GDT1 family)
VVFLGAAFAKNLPMKKIHLVASVLFAILGLYFVAKALMHWLHWSL